MHTEAGMGADYRLQWERTDIQRKRPLIDLPPRANHLMKLARVLADSWTRTLISSISAYLYLHFSQTVQCDSWRPTQ
jgi:hypothetical protein